MIICESCGEILNYNGSGIVYTICSTCSKQYVGTYDKIIRKKPKKGVESIDKHEKLSKAIRLRRIRKNFHR